MAYSIRPLLLLTLPLFACPDSDPVSEVGGGSSSTGEPQASSVTITTTPGTGVPPTADTTDDGTTAADETTSNDGASSDDASSDDASTSDGGSTAADDSDGTTGSGSTTDGGPACGDRVIDDNEDCDGDELGGATCESLGFVSGEVSCAGDCTFDTTQCETCGDDLIDAGEACDGADLGMATCDSIGLDFVGGTLGCAADCNFDVSMCESCGNGMADVGEDCDGADLGGNGCTDLGMGFTGGALDCDLGCGYDTAACTSFPLPAPGEVVITEIMQNPDVLGDSDGEWFELHNPTPGVTYELGGCTVEGSLADAGFTIDVDLQVGPLEYRTLATDTVVDPGFTPDFTWVDADFGLTNGTDTVALVCNGLTIDTVSYDDGATFPDPTGQSMNLDPGSFDVTANDDGENWCPGTISYNGDFGTPGTDNSTCGAVVSYPIDFCRLQFPVVVNEVEGSAVDAFGRLFIAGLTDITGVNDLSPVVIGSVGYGPDGSDPAVDPGWTWVEGTGNPAYGPAAPGYEANNDEYQAVLPIPSPPGDYDFAFRFSGDSGATFTYCDAGLPGSSDGYAAVDAGQMTSTAAVVPDLYFSEYIEGSSNNKALEIYNASGVDAELANCAVEIYFNGAAVPGTTVDLAGTVAFDDVYVVCDEDIVDPSACDLFVADTVFNGDDAVELICGPTTLDIIGQIGFDPGSQWTAMGVGTQNETIRRDCAVTAGDANGMDAFDPSAEWTSFAQDDLTDLGQYVCP